MTNSYRDIELDGTCDPTARAPLGVRLPNFIGADDDAATRLGGLRVTLVGAGSVGQVIGAHLARLQIAELSVVDSGMIKESSLITHSLAFAGDVGKSKADVLGRRVKEISPQTRVRVYDGPVSELGLGALSSAQLVVLAVDNLHAELEVGRASRLLGLNLIQATIHGETMTVNVRVFGNDRDAGGPCPACGYNEAEFEALNGEVRFSCDALVAYRTPRISGPVTASTSFLCAIGAELAMVTMVRHLLSLGRPVLDTLLQWNGYTGGSVVSPLKRNPRCGGEHRVCRRVPSNHPIGECSPRQLLIAAGLATRESYSGVSLRLDQRVYAARSFCGCEVSQPFGRFFRTGRGEEQDGAVCGSCGEPMRPQAFFTFDPVPLLELAGDLDRPLEQLGASGAGWAMVRGPEESVLIGI